ncbi:unnamed protein product [Schistosoma margrebowiei]|uniref:Uncharacterized protein n=1 Tax=Schistosoma margrebowiei TaxID=48269 RepID=A0A183N2A8_9TREM|nr:unnamed protein product [Schistosoma margrebowiei]
MSQLKLDQSGKSGITGRPFRPIVGFFISAPRISIEILDKIQEKKNKKTTVNNSRTRAEKVKAPAEYTNGSK